MQLGLYGASVDTTQVGWLIWNDQVYYNLSGKVVNHEQDSSGNYYAHSKGSLLSLSLFYLWLTVFLLFYFLLFFYLFLSIVC
jgi:hypothetical protein